MSFGPIDFIVVRFPGTSLSGEIASSLRSLIEAGTIRIVDLLFAVKDAEGNVTVEEIGDLDDVTYARWDSIVDAISGFMTDEDAFAIAELLDPGSSAVIALIENTWAVQMVKTIAEAQGEVVISERIPRPVVEELVAQHVD
jgi:uncharacterized membrane protein